MFVVSIIAIKYRDLNI